MFHTFIEAIKIVKNVDFSPTSKNKLSKVVEKSKAKLISIDSK